jgi:4-amino-4-deoxy-L-arabinose transferase-like glycosyltransferase
MTSAVAPIEASFTRAQSRVSDGGDGFSWKVLISIVAVALVLRIAFMLFFTPVISGDGCEYIRMGIDLRDGKPLTGSFDWPETMYGTLYPVLIAGVSRLGLSAEHAAYLLSLLFATALVPVAFLVSRRVYGTHTGYIAAALFAVFPVFVGLGGSVFNESIYLTLWMTGIYWSLLALDSFRPLHFTLAGILFGLATLSRPESFAYPIFLIGSAILVAVLRRIALWKALRGAALIFVPWLVLMAPYAAFQHAHTGQYRFEGKWNINYTIGNRMDAGMSFWEAGYTVDQKRHFIGPLLDSSLYAAYTPYPHSLRDKLAYMGRRIRQNWSRTYEEVVAVDFGGPLMLLLVVLGLFGTEWSTQRLRHEFVLIAMAGSIIFLMLTAAHIEHRYAYPLPVILLLWVAAGLVRFRDWTARTIQSWTTPLAHLWDRVAQLVVLSLCFLFVVFCLVGVRTDWYFLIQGRDFSGIKQAGLWLKHHAPPAQRMFGFEGRVAYYAGATIIIFPCADSTETLRYLESKNIDYIVLDSLSAHNLPTFAQWYENGVPDPRAHLVFQSNEGNKDTIRIYKWDNNAAFSAGNTSGVKE